MSETFSVRLPDALKDEVSKIAVATSRSRAYIIKEAVEAYVEQRQAYLSALDDAVREADKGVFVSGEKVFAWLEQLKTYPQTPAPEADVFKA